jgi:carbon monoxide dehydrogenase subunit G
MPVIEENVIISRAPEDVFEFITRAENLAVYDSSVIEAHAEGDEPTGVGTRWIGVSKVLGRRFEWTLEVTEFESPTLLRVKTVAGKVPFSVTSSLRPDDAGTQFTYRIEAESGLGGVFGRLADPLVEKAQARTVRANLGTLAELLSNPEG